MTQTQKITPMMEQYLKVKNEYKDYLLFYRMGDFYEMFFDDAKIASEVLNIALTHRGTYLGIPIPMCGIPFHAISSYIPKLVNKGFRIAICDQTETPEQAKLRVYKAVVTRQVQRIITSGTLTEENLINTSLNNYLMVLLPIKLNNNLQITVAICDISTGEFTLETFKNNSIVELFSYTLTRNPAEIIAPNNIIDDTEFKEFINRFKEKIIFRPLTFFDFFTGQKIIKDFYKVENLNSFGVLDEYEISAVSAIINYVKLTQIDNIPNLSYPIKQEQNKYLKLDAFSIKNLEIFEELNKEDGTKSSSLFSIMDKTKTPMGKRKLKQVLSTPLTDVIQINSRLDLTEFFYNRQSLIEEIRDILTSIFDLQRIVNRISCNRAGPRDIQNIGFTLQKIKPLRNILKNECDKNNINKIELLENIINDLKDFDLLSTKILDAIEDEAPITTNATGFIKTGYNKQLEEYANLSKNSRQVILNLNKKYIEATNISSLKIKYNNIMGYFIEVSPRFSNILFNSKEYIFRHKQTLLNAVRFTTDELSQIEQKILLADDQYANLELELFNDLCNEIYKRYNDINKVASAIADLDLFSSFALLAIQNNYIKPFINNTLDFKIIDGRHPVVEQYLKEQNINFIPNDCVLQNENQNTRIWVLTGPNMAGKSTFLRSNALIIIMAQIGSFVPASSATIGVVNKLYSRVGASDNLAKGQSTFMVEMSETATILNQADEKSFVILDEIGRGTATFDGLAIAGAVLEYLNNKIKCRGLFATHYHELQNNMNDLKNISSHTMEIKEYNKDIIFMHKVILGNVSKSYGIHVAKLAGVPISVIQKATDILNKLEAEKTNLNSNLDLFNFKNSSTQITDSYKDDYETLKNKIENITPDEITPKQAINIVYELKDFIKSQTKNLNSD